MTNKIPQIVIEGLAASFAEKAPLASPAFTGTPTGITKAHVGLGSVDNTSDANKPISTATQTALDGKSSTTKLSGGDEIVLTGNTTITTVHDKTIIVVNSASEVVLTMSSPSALVAGWFGIIRSIGTGVTRITGTFENSVTELRLQQGGSMVITSNGTTLRSMLRSGNVTPLRETIVGTGSATYTLVNVPPDKNSMIAFVGGAVQGNDRFTLVGNQVTFDGTVAVGERIEVLVINGTASGIVVSSLYAKHTGLGTVGPFTLQDTPPSPQSLTITVGGIVQPRDGSAYSVIGNQITFSEAIDVSTYWDEHILVPLGIGVPGAGTVGADEINDLDIAATRTKLQIDNIPVGMVLFSPKGTVPAGFLVCEGATYDTATYPDLFAYLGVNTLPDYRDRVLRGAGTLAGAVFTTQEDAIQNHSHSTGYELNSGLFTAGAGSVKYNAASGDNTATTGANGRFNANETRVKAAIGKFVIKAFAAIVDPGTLNLTSLATTVNDKVNKADIVGALVSGGNGRIIERGSNANGEYTKFADGTMICTAQPVTVHAISGGSGLAGLYQTTSVTDLTFPVAFIAAATVAPTGIYIAGSNYPIAVCLQAYATYARFSMFGTHSNMTATYRYIAVGRWF